MDFWILLALYVGTALFGLAIARSVERASHGSAGPLLLVLALVLTPLALLALGAIGGLIAVGLAFAGVVRTAIDLFHRRKSRQLPDRTV